MYADDTTISIIGKNLEELNNRANAVISSVHDWCLKNCMILNESKTKYLLITNYQKRATLNLTHLDINIGQIPIKQSSEEKLLGVYINENLSWETHIHNLCKKLSNKIMLLKRLKIYMDVPTRVQFYNAYIFSSLSYCCAVWGLLPTVYTNRLFQFQRRAARIIFDKPYDYPYEVLFKKLNWLDFHSLVKYRTVLQTFKCLNNLAQVYLKELFLYLPPSNYDLRLRNKTLLSIPSYRTVMYEYSYSVQGAKLFNELSIILISIEKFSKFKSDVFNHFCKKFQKINL